MKIAIVGSRNFTNYALLKKTIDECGLKITAIVSGGAKGADSLARQYAQENNIEIKEYIPNWNKFGKAAGFIRNKDIINDADFVIAFWDGVSRGTEHSINFAHEKKIPVKICRFSS